MNTSPPSSTRDAAPPPGSARFLARDGARLHYRDEGAGPALVLIHGWLMDLTAWDAEQPAWSARFRVLRMDRRGFGRSTGVPRLAGDTDDVLALLDELRVERAAVLGMSQGARIALDLAQRAPERVSALILDGAPGMDALPGGPWLQETPLERYRKMLVDGGIEALRAELAEHPLMRLCTREPAPRKALDAMLARYSGADLADPTSGQATRAPDPTGLRVPALILNGERDTPQRLAAGAALARTIPGCARRVIPQAGHLACLDQPDTYGRIVSDFLVHNTQPTPLERMESP
jgi:pimeloyl-ACP methyl ester carboxylesterase